MQLKECVIKKKKMNTNMWVKFQTNWISIPFNEIRFKKIKKLKRICDFMFEPAKVHEMEKKKNK